MASTVRPRLDTASTVAEHFRACLPGVVATVDLDAILGRVDRLEAQDAALAILAVIDWRSGVSAVRLATMLNLESRAVVRMVLQGRAALARAGLGPDGAPGDGR